MVQGWQCLVSVLLPTAAMAQNYQDPYAPNYNYNNAGFQDPYYAYGAQPDNHARYDSSGSGVVGNRRSAANSTYSSVEKRRTEAFLVGEPPKNTGDLRIFRHEVHGNLWRKGGNARTIGRFCCCSIMTLLVVILAVGLSIAMWLRPPDVTIGNISPPTNGSAIEASSTELKLNFALPIEVKNPNFFSVTFEQIKAKAIYPVNNVEVGGGSRDYITFETNSDTSFNFPFSIVYTQSKDPDGKVLMDIANRCGFTGSPEQPISLKYSITLRIKILVFSISPSFDGQTSFKCPLQRDQLAPFLGGLLGGS